MTLLVYPLGTLFVLCGFLLIFACKRQLLLNSQTPSKGKTVGNIGALLVVVGLIVQISVNVFSVFLGSD